MIDYVRGKKLSVKMLSVLFIIFFGILALVSIIQWRPVPMGESDDYMLSTVSLENRFDLCVRESDLEQAITDFPSFSSYLEENYSQGRMSEFVDNSGGRLPWYFGTYSLSCIPIKKCLELLKLPQEYAFALTNFLFYILASVMVLQYMQTDSIKRFYAVALTMVNPIVFYLVWQSAEVFIYSMVVIATVFFSNKSYKRAALFLSLAGTMNPTIMFFGFIIIYDYFRNLLSSNEGKGAASIFREYFKDIIGFGCCFIISLLPFVYNYVKFGILNLQASYGFAERGDYGGRVWAYLTDLNYGLLPYYPILLLLLIVMVIIFLVRRKRDSRIVLYGLALLGVICSFSIMKHINCGMSGIARYNAWVTPIFIIGIVSECDILFPSMRLKKIVKGGILLSIVYLALVINQYGFMFAHKTSDIKLTPIAYSIMDKYPALYSPLPSTFVDRVEHIPGGYNYELPVFFSNGKGEIRKILVDNQSINSIYDVIDGNADSKYYLSQKIDNYRGGLGYINIKKGTELFLNSKYLLNSNESVENGIVAADKLSIIGRGKMIGKGLILYAEDIQFGPYIVLGRGRYSITIHGNNLSFPEYTVTAENGEELIDVLNLTKNNAIVNYIVEIQEKKDFIEFCARNSSEETVRIDYIEIQQCEP